MSVSWWDGSRAAAVFATALASPACVQSATDASLPPLMSSPGIARGGPGAKPNRPSALILRQDEDWSALADPAKRTDPLDALKYIPLDDAGNTFLTTAFDGFLSYRGFKNELNGVLPGYDGSFNTRANVHVGLTVGERFRLYGAIKHGDSFDRASPVAPVNRNRLDLHQAFVEVGIGDAVGLQPRALVLRAGRQEIHYGNGALISARLGPNVRSDWDGFLVRLNTPRIVSDAFVYRAVADRADVFDDRPDRNNVLWGSYTTLAGKPLNVDLIYIGQRRRNSVYATVAGPLTETRHSVGGRLWSMGPSLGGFSVDVEAEYQFGSARTALGRRYHIAAYNLVGVFSYPATTLPLKPTFGLELGLNSGDGDPADNEIGTFRAPAPPGRYFGEANAFGPGNLTGFRPYVELHPTKALRIKPKATFFWRLEDEDGNYTLAPTVLRPGKGDRNYLGVEPALEVGYVFGPHVTFTGFVARFANARYFADNPPDRDITYVEATLAFRY